MVQWYKEKTFVFKLKNLVVQEEYVLWKAWDKRNEEITDYSPTQQVMKFPLREGDQLVGSDGKVYLVEDTKWMKTAVFKQIFPKLNRQTKYIRTVLVGGLEYKYRFGSTVNNAINSLIGLNQGMLPQTYLKQTFFPNEAPSKMYQLTAISVEDAKAWEKLALPTTVEQTGAPKSQSSIEKEQIEVQLGKKSELTEFEQQFLDNLKALPNKLEEQKFVKAFVATSAKYGKVAEYTSKDINIEERGKALFDNYYNK